MLRSQTSVRIRAAVIQTSRAPETPLLDHSPALTEVVTTVQTRDERPSNCYLKYAEMIMKYVEANSLTNVLARVDLCINGFMHKCIKAIPSTI